MMRSLVSMSVSGISAHPHIPRERKISPLPSPPILYPISYGILDPITRLLLSFKACSEERGIPNSNISLSLYPCVYHLLPTEGFGSSDKQSRHHRDPITKAKDTSTLTYTSRHTHTHIHRGAFKESRVYNRLAFWECCPCAFVWNKLNNLRLLHEFHNQHTGWIISLKYETLYVLNERISEEVLCFRFSGMMVENLVTSLNPSIHKGWQSKEIQGCGINMTLVSNPYFMPVASLVFFTLFLLGAAVSKATYNLPTSVCMSLPGKIILSYQIRHSIEKVLQTIAKPKTNRNNFHLKSCLSHWLDLLGCAGTEVRHDV